MGAVTVITLTPEELRAIVREEVARVQAVPAVATATGREDDLTVPAAAKRAGCSPATIRAWIADGTLPRRRVGRHYRVAPADLERALTQAKGAAPVDLDARRAAILARHR